VPESHAILFTQGGGTTQFSAVVLNLLAYHRLKHAKTHGDALYPPPALDYVVTGSWSSKAAAEAKRLIQPTAVGQAPLATVNLAASTKNSGFKTLPNREDYKFSRDPAFVYYCENETINGVQFPLPSSQSTSGSSTQDSPLSFPFDLVPADTPLVADYSSSFISRPIPHIERHALIYAGAQKNLGPSGVTIIIIRKDLLVDTASATLLGGVPACPIALEYKVQADNASLYNTPPTFAIYVCALVLEYLQSHEGGIKGLEERNGRKAGKLYEAIERAEEKGKLRCIVKEKDARSWMNVVFEVVESADGDANEKKFLAGAEERGFRQLKGHRSVGGEFEKRGPYRE
jgi:phosphoserine aminotransferase